MLGQALWLQTYIYADSIRGSLRIKFYPATTTKYDITELVTDSSAKQQEQETRSATPAKSPNSAVNTTLTTGRLQH